MPTIPETSDIQGCINTILEIQKYNKNIVVIANKLEKDEDLEFVQNAVNQIGKYAVFPIKKSRALPNIYIEKKSIVQMMEESPLHKHLFKKVAKQFDR